MKKVLSLIGLAKKAGKVSNGTMAARTSLIKRKAFLLVMSNDIAINTKADLLKDGEKTNTPWIIIGDKYELGNSVGKAYRVAITINDYGMAQAILEELKTAGLSANSMGVV